VLLVPIQQLFVRVVPRQQLFPCDHNPQSRGITGLLDMKRLLFAQMGRGKIQCALQVSCSATFAPLSLHGALHARFHGVAWPVWPK
jgi:hypothetical protein